jgi:hypothetical protein
MHSNNEPTKRSRPDSSTKSGVSPERAKYLLDDLVKTAKAGQVKLAPGNTVPLLSDPAYGRW